MVSESRSVLTDSTGLFGLEKRGMVLSIENLKKDITAQVQHVLASKKSLPDLFGLYDV